jgi:diguanylate cyclase (GGDEF)-like protein
VGDAALKAIARILATRLPASAIACRYGGEEFACCLPGQDLAAARALAEALRAAIAAPGLLAERPELRLTASLGVAAVAAGERGREALARADAACYRAKAAGRDRVEAAP